MRASTRFVVGAVLCLAAASVRAQDPLVVLPQAYKRVLENDWVRVIRVHYAPHEKLAMHSHPELAVAYVYLNDGGPVIFTHDYGALTRPPTTAGSFRLYRGVKEIHEVENPNDAPSDFLRVEFKTRPLNATTLKGRFHREPNPDGQGFEKVQFNNEQLRVTRYVVSPGKRAEVSTATEPALLIALTTGQLKALCGASAEEIPLELGLARWLPRGSGSTFENVGGAAVEFLRFDLKTEPLTDGASFPPSMDGIIRPAAQAPRDSDRTWRRLLRVDRTRSGWRGTGGKRTA